MKMDDLHMRPLIFRPTNLFLAPFEDLVAFCGGASWHAIRLRECALATSAEVQAERRRPRLEPFRYYRRPMRLNHLFLCVLNYDLVSNIQSILNRIP